MTAIKKALAAARECGVLVPVIPPQRNRKVAREYDAALYQARHQVENGFSKLKERRGVAWRRVMPRMRRHTWRFARYGLGAAG